MSPAGLSLKETSAFKYGFSPILAPALCSSAMTTKKQPETDPTPVPACRRGRTLVVDDSPAFPDSFCAYPETLTGLEVVGTADNRRDGVVKSETLRPDLLLLPLDMPIVNGLNAATQVRREFPALRVVVMSVRDEPVWA